MKTIQIMYKSGDSFSDWEAACEIPAIWENRKAIEEALLDIYEHHEYYERIHGNSSKESPEEKQRLYNEVITKRWYLSTKEYYEFILEGAEGIEGLKGRLDIDLEKMDEEYNTWQSDWKWDEFIMLTLDSGIKLRVNSFWVGYFEKFHEAKIVDVEDSLKRKSIN